MKNLNLLLFGLSMLIISCGSPGSKNSEITKKNSPKLTLLWQTDTTMSTCEAVRYDPERNVIYVSNINSNPWEKDGNGFISRLDTLGNVLDLKWIEGISGPKGLGIYGNTLYVADIDELVEIDIAQGVIIKKHLVPGNPNLNDITVDDKGTVFVSGSGSHAIYQLKDDTVEIITTEDMGRVNGLFYKEGSLLFVTSDSQKLGKFDLISKKYVMLADSLGHGDGIEAIGNGDYLISDWSGTLFYMHSDDWKSEVLLNTREEEIQAADIGFIQKGNILLLPTFFSNRVEAYRLEFN